MIAVVQCLSGIDASLAAVDTAETPPEDILNPWVSGSTRVLREPKGCLRFDELSAPGFYG